MNFKTIGKALACSVVALGLLLCGRAAAYEQVIYYHNDVAGSPIAATDASGNVIWKETYKPYGERLKNQDGGTNAIWFHGKPSDSETGLSYFTARYYDPSTGRFVSTDPKGFDPGNIHSSNRFAYANNNPYRYIDPDGRESIAIRQQERMQIAYMKGDISRQQLVEFYDAQQTGAAIGSLVTGVGELGLLARAGIRMAIARFGASEAKSLVANGADVTPGVIQQALAGDTIKTAQSAVSLPAIRRYVQRLLDGETAPAIKMDGDVIVDGNHRYIAGKIAGQTSEVEAGTLAPSQAGNVKPISGIKIDPVDWGNQ